MSRDNATPGLLTAARTVLREIADILQNYPKAVIVGGSVPYLIIPQEMEPHEGTVDIDIVFDLDQPSADDVYTLHEIFERRLFQQDPKKPFRYAKGVQVEAENYQVVVELMAGGDPPPSGLRRIEAEDVFVTVIKGLEVALDAPVEVQFGDDPTRRVSVASLPAFFAMKAMALQRREERKKAKDAYDIVYCLRNYPGGVDTMAQEFCDAISNPIVASGVELLRRLFAETDSVGPVAYGRQADNGEIAALMAREAFERVDEFLRNLDRRL